MVGSKMPDSLKTETRAWPATRSVGTVPDGGNGNYGPSGKPPQCSHGQAGFGVLAGWNSRGSKFP